MRFAFSLAIFLCIVGIVYSQTQVSSVGAIKCPEERTTSVCLRTLEKIKGGPLTTDRAFNDSFLYKYAGSCSASIEYIKKVAGCEKCGQSIHIVTKKPLCQESKKK